VQTLEAAASQAHLELALVKAVAWTDRRGAAGEYGVLQVMPGTAQLVNQKLIGCSLDPAVPGNSLRQGTVLLRYLLDRAGNQVAPALAAYHSGYSQMDARNRPYVTAVLRYRDWFMHHPRADRAAAARYLG
jgi:soluble lytic murein transglycosylase-like protein